MTTSSIDLTRAAIGPWLADRIRTARTLMGMSQDHLAARARTSQATIWRIESGHADHLDLKVVERVFAVLGLKATVSISDRHLDDRRRQSDGVHARISGCGASHLGDLAWLTALEVRIGDDVPRGWIDLLGFRAIDRALLVDETKADLPDMGALQRSLAFYEREAPYVARRLGWTPRSVTVMVLALDSDQMASRLRDNRGIVKHSFPGVVADLDAWLRDPARPQPCGWTIAMVDPASRSDHWLRPPVLGTSRRGPAYRDYADAARRLLRSS
jgi:transcriptional regulator with XRE-family HTH domain